MLASPETLASGYIVSGFPEGNTHTHTYTPNSTLKKPFTGCNELLHMFAVSLVGLLKSLSRLTLQSDLFKTQRDAEI